MDAGFGIILVVFYLGLIFLILASMWKLFEKMGEEGWKSIIPIYNYWIIAEKVGKPGYWSLLALIPYIGVVWSIWLLNLWLKKFGKDEVYTVLTLFFGIITIPMLAFGDAKWIDDDSQEINLIGKE